MNGWIDPVRQYWITRTAREQVLLAIMAGIIGVTIIFLGIIQPLMSYRNQSLNEFQDALETHVTTVENIEIWNETAQSRPDNGNDTRSLQTLVAEQARQSGLTLSRIQPLENNQLGVWAENVSEQVLMTTLIQLRTEHNLHIQRITIDREDGGLVRTQFLLTRAG